MNLLLKHIKLFPNCEAQDIYKFLHQANFGPKHALKYKAKVEELLLKEWNNLEAVNFKENLYDILNEKLNLVRLNLRPFKLAGGNSSQVLSCFFKTANIINGDLISFQTSIKNAIITLGHEGKDRITKDLHNLYNEINPLFIPVYSHSSEYKKYYKPAYRVITLYTLKELTAIEASLLDHQRK